MGQTLPWYIAFITSQLEVYANDTVGSNRWYFTQPGVVVLYVTDGALAPVLGGTVSQVFIHDYKMWNNQLSFFIIIII